MARFTMSDLERIAAGQGSDAGTSQHLDSAGTSQHVIWYQPTIYSRIMDAVERGGAHTRLEIARYLGVKKSPWLVDRIERLAAEGHIVKIESRSETGTILWVYEVRK
jgi:hypothetical protein